MKITAPYVGHLWMPLRMLGAKTGLELIEPPPPSRRTISLGVSYSPEWLCFPFKVILGNFLEAIERGADTVLMAEGPQLCRLGYYSRLYEQILHENGHPEVRVLTLNWQDEQIVALAKFLRTILGEKISWREIVSLIKHGLQQYILIEEVEQRVQSLRPRARNWLDVEAIWDKAEARVAAALTGRDLQQVRRDLFAELDTVRLDPQADPLRVGILGEFILAMDPFQNLDLEKELGQRGVEVHRCSWVAGWAKIWLFMQMLGLSHGKEVKQAAAPYLKRDVSGEGLQTIGETVLMSQDGYDGICHLQPFTCLPEVVAQNILPRVVKDHNIPVLEIIIDEQTARTGLLTRLEAFVDLMARRRAIRRRGDRQ
jgi:predicted nucleotide-binding protein (sugar kinase/HSP70/actin superfamily)